MLLRSRMLLLIRSRARVCAFWIALALVLGSRETPAQTSAQAYPGKPIRVIDAYPPGGSTDVVARIIAAKFQEATGQPWVVDNRMARVDMLHIPYKGSAPAVLDLIGGHVDLMFAPLPVMLPHIKSGRARPLAVSTPKRSGALPEVPTVAEAALACCAHQEGDWHLCRRH